MQTGQNSIAPENSLPQLGQVRWGSVLMGPSVHWPQFEQKATLCSNQRRLNRPARYLARCGIPDCNPTCIGSVAIKFSESFEQRKFEQSKSFLKCDKLPKQCVVSENPECS
jgi:hypothetical protein